MSHHEPENSEIRKLLEQMKPTPPVGSSLEDNELKARLLDQMLRREIPHHPDGRLVNHDEGQLSYAVAVDQKNQVILINFGKPVVWVGLSKRDTLNLIALLTEKAKEL